MSDWFVLQENQEISICPQCFLPKRSELTSERGYISDHQNGVLELLKSFVDAVQRLDKELVDVGPGGCITLRHIAANGRRHQRLRSSGRQ